MPPRVFLNSVPKAGAHLAEKAMTLLGVPRGARSIGSLTLYSSPRLPKSVERRPLLTSDLLVVGIEMATPIRASWIRRRLAKVEPGHYIRGHVRHSEYFAHLLEEGGFRLLHVVRDPRDVAVSHAHYMMDRTKHPLHAHYRDLGEWSARLAFSIAGGPVEGVGHLDSLAARYASMESWNEHPGALTLRFEDLVGEAGGGAAEDQETALAELMRFLEQEPDPARIAALRDGLFGGTSTFRKGRVGGWREAFDDENLALFERVAGHLVTGGPAE
jgi:hypothetical protein